MQQVFKHLFLWILIWLVQSALFAGHGYEIPAYLVKNLAVVSLQALVVYANWQVLKGLSWSALSHVVMYAVGCLLCVYVTMAVSYDWIAIIMSIFYSGLVLDASGGGFWPMGFWNILSGSAPYSVVLLISTVVYLIRNGAKGHEIASDEVASGNDVLTIQDGKTIHRLRKDHILYVEGLREYVNWHTAERKVTTLHSLKAIEEMLDNEGFFRIHKSYIVNASRVRAVRPQSN